MEKGEAKILAIGGGKGGVGKSLIATNLGVALANSNKKVVIIDADLGGENLHLLFGIHYPTTTLSDFFSKKAADLNEVSIKTCVNNLSIIAGGADIINLANPHYQQKQKLLRHIKKLEADYILVDLGAGTSFNVIDFYNISNNGIVVMTPEPTSIQNIYLFLKNVVYRKLSRAFAGNKTVTEIIANYGKQSGNLHISGLINAIKGADHKAAEQANDVVGMIKPKLILNMLRKEKDAQFVESLKGVSKTYLSLSLEFMGHLAYDIEIRQSIGNMIPFMFSDNLPRATRQMNNIAEILSSNNAPKQSITKNTLMDTGNVLRGYNDNVEHEGTLFHVQTEVFLRDKHQIITVVYRDGQILFSKKQPFNKESNARDDVLRQHYAIVQGIRAGKLSIASEKNKQEKESIA